MVLRYGIHIVYKNGDEVEMWFSTESKREKEFLAIKNLKLLTYCGVNTGLKKHINLEMR